MQKRGQATIFIVLGILVVILVILVFFFQDQLFKSEWERSRIESLTIPDQAEEVHSYLSSCIEDVVQEPLDIIGIQGGYIEIPNDPIPVSAYNPFSNALEIFSGYDMKTAYWFYESANGVQNSQMPTLEEMQKEIADYVNVNVVRCVDDFGLLEEYNVSMGEVNTEVEILDNKVLFTIDYPVYVVMDDFSFEFPPFYESLDVPLGNMYNAAVTIQMKENEDFYLENMVYDVLVLDENVPLSDTSFDCDAEDEWNVDDVETALKESLQLNMGNIRIVGTDYETDGYSGYFEWNVLGGGFDNLDANVMYYDSWPLGMDVYPSANGVLSSNSWSDSGITGAMLKSFFCMNDYNFIYDIKFPVLISLSDKDTGYVYQFATMVILDNNQPRENAVLEDLVDIDEDLICDEGVTDYTVYALDVDDQGYLIDVSEVNLKFKCGAYSCDYGNFNSGDEVLLPACYNGEVIVEKDGYVAGSETISTFESGSVSVVLEKYINLSYEIKAVDLDGIVRALTSDEIVYIGLTDEDSGYSTFVYYPYSDQEVVLVPGVYQVEGVLMQDKGFDINIPSQVLQGCTSTSAFSLTGIFGLGETCTDVNLDSIDLQSVLGGGVDIEWEPDRFDLYNAEHITFYVTEPYDVQSQDDIEEAYTMYEMNLGNLEPELE